MKPILLGFASLSGNTEYAARTIEKGLLSQGVYADIYDLAEMDANQLRDYDGIILGTYSWGDGDVPEECLDFYDGLEALHLDEKLIAVFGTGDPSYPDFCGAVDRLYDQLMNSGANIVMDRLKIELDPVGEEYQLCLQFGQQFAELYSRMATLK